MNDLISRAELRHQFDLLIAAKPFDCEPYKEGQYAGLRTAVRLLDKMPNHICECANARGRDE